MSAEDVAAPSGGGAPEGAAGGRGGADAREPRRPFLAVSDRLPVLWRTVCARPRARGRPVLHSAELIVLFCLKSALFPTLNPLDFIFRHKALSHG